MNTNKIQEDFSQQHIGKEEHRYAGKETCLLEEDDVQCGQVFFSESSWILKFFCTYCRETYLDINYFCEHLSEHVNGNEDSDKASTATFPEEEDEDLSVELTSSQRMEDSNSFSEDESEHFVSSDVEDFDTQDMIVEELDDADEIAAEVEEEMRQALENEHNLLNEENSSSADFLGYAEDDLTVESNVQKNLNFQECFMRQTRYRRGSEGLTNQSVKDALLSEESPETPKPTKRKRVTTVKIIAAKNRVEELYAKIRLEEEKRSNENVIDFPKRENNPNTYHILQSNHSPIQTNDVNIANACEGNIAEEAHETTQPELVRKIIGETLITLLPEGSALPTPTSSTSKAITSNSISRYNRNVKDKDCTCPACGKIFRSSFSLAIHKRTHYLETNSAIKLAHKCSDCDELFNKYSEMKEHLQKAHYPNGFICKICQKKLSSLSMLESHMRKMHLLRRFSCEMCKKNFNNREAFELHVTSHIGGQIFKCQICGRKYTNEIDLNQHVSNHKERTPQCCVVCGKITFRITQHMKIHTPRPKRILSCSVCGKIFNFSSGLSQHFKAMHSVSQPPSKSRRQSSNITPLNENSPDSYSSTDVGNEVQEKEEEAKRVIVELIKNATYTSFLPENYTSIVDGAPPIAREETISAINSIVDDC